MKLRIKGNSIRLRLTKSEVLQFSETGVFEEKTSFGKTELVYRLKSMEGSDILSASYENNVVTVFMEQKLASAWYTSDDVGYKHIFKPADDSEIFLLVEKDFVCLDETFEDQSDNYDNPNASC
ncbi:MAG: hypothetical protein IPH94_17715 [Saprospiraceae bacterium]|nr:hypothetical protein [Saprospiraceae bacterium]